MVPSIPTSRLLALVVVAVCLPAWADAPRASGPPPPRFALTISGGASLGAYEAGATWAFLRFMRGLEEGGPEAARTRLAVATGASAGSLNATLAALAWCSAHDASTVDDNPFLRAWRGVGLEELLPAEWRAYRPDDGLLARAALEPAERELRALLAAGDARACQVRLGMTATADQPLVTPIAGLSVKDQTVAIPLQITARAGVRPVVRSQRLPHRRVAGGRVLHLSGGSAAEDGEVEIEADELVGAVKASGAFPLAFGAMTLPMCVEGCPARDLDLLRLCPVPNGRPVQGRACRGAFRDGGVFDNTPLQLAVELAEAAPGGAEHPTVYLYVDPDLRRSQALLTGEETAAARPGPGLARELAFFAAATTYARERSLYDALRGSRWNRDLPQLLGAAAEGLRDLRRLAPSETGGRSRAAPLARAEPGAVRAFIACAPADRAALPERCLSAAPADVPPLTVGEGAAFASAARAALASLAGRGEPAGWSDEAPSLETAAALLRGLQVLAERGAFPAGDAARPAAVASLKEMARFAARLEPLCRGETFQRGEAPEVCQRLASFGELAEDAGRGGVSRPLVISRRFAPLTASLFLNFGAFIDPAFSEADYLVGVYDAAYGFAAYRCGQATYGAGATSFARGSDPEDARCLGIELSHAAERLGVPGSPAAWAVYRRLARAEGGALGAAGQESWRWADAAAGDSDGAVPKVVEALLSQARSCDPADAVPLCVADPTLDEFVEALRRNGYRSELVDAPERWEDERLIRLANRGLALERAPGFGRVAWAGTQLLVRSSYRGTGLHDPSTLPGLDEVGPTPARLVAAALPHRLSTGVSATQLAAAWWEPVLDLHPRAALQLRNDISTDFVHGPSLALRPSLVVNRTGLLSASVGLAAGRSWPWWPDRAGATRLGVEFGVGVARDGLRLVLTSLPGPGEPSGSSWNLRLDLSDVAGLVYWLTRM